MPNPRKGFGYYFSASFNKFPRKCLFCLERHCNALTPEANSCEQKIYFGIFILPVNIIQQFFLQLNMTIVKKQLEKKNYWRNIWIPTSSFNCYNICKDFFVLQYVCSTIYKTFLCAQGGSPLDCCLYYNTLLSLVGAWLGAFPIPLDWDRDWQVSVRLKQN